MFKVNKIKVKYLHELTLASLYFSRVILEAYLRSSQKSMMEEKSLTTSSL